MITRRCTQRQFLMRPDAATSNAFIYCLGEAANRYGIVVLFTIAMSNHHHTGIYDPNGNCPAFLEHFHKLFAKCQNALRGRWENFWSSEQTSVVRLVDPKDVVEKMVYALTNPVKAGLVQKAHHWPGVSSLTVLLHGGCLIATRPKHFFRDDGDMPETVRLEIGRPVGHAEPANELVTRVLKRVAEVEEQVAGELAGQGRHVLGRRAVLQQDWREQPQSREPRRGPSPRIAARSKWSRIEALMRNAAFHDAYLAARADFIVKGRPH